MLQAGHGSIVNISSAAGVFKAAPNRYVYGATKAAVAALTRAVATDFITKGIRCNCICPGTIETPSMLNRAAAAGPGGREMFVSRQPMGRLGTADEIASLAVYLASDESSFTTGVRAYHRWWLDALIFNLSPLLAGRGRKLREAEFPGEGRGTMLTHLRRCELKEPLTPTLSPRRAGRGSRLPPL